MRCIRTYNVSQIYLHSLHTRSQHDMHGMQVLYAVCLYRFETVVRSACRRTVRRDPKGVSMDETASRRHVPRCTRASYDEQSEVPSFHLGGDLTLVMVNGVTSIGQIGRHLCCECALLASRVGLCLGM